jgi:phosphatidylglycerol:prolipoprotein diacylglycerol transferase
VVFPPECHAGSIHPGVPLHPAQLYSSAVGFGLFGLLMLWDRKPRPRGHVFLVFIALYAVARFLLDLVREYDSTAFPIPSVDLTLNQWVSIGVLLFAGWKLMAGRKVAARAGAPR